MTPGDNCVPLTLPETVQFLLGMRELFFSEDAVARISVLIPLWPRLKFEYLPGVLATPSPHYP